MMNHPGRNFMAMALPPLPAANSQVMKINSVELIDRIGFAQDITILTQITCEN